jgi:hypothetical protein
MGCDGRKTNKQTNKQTNEQTNCPNNNKWNVHIRKLLFSNKFCVKTAVVTRPEFVNHPDLATQTIPLPTQDPVYVVNVAALFLEAANLQKHPAR